MNQANDGKLVINAFYNCSIKNSTSESRPQPRWDVISIVAVRSLIPLPPMSNASGWQSSSKRLECLIPRIIPNSLVLSKSWNTKENCSIVSERWKKRKNIQHFIPTIWRDTINLLLDIWFRWCVLKMELRILFLKFPKRLVFVANHPTHRIVPNGCHWVG